MGGGQSLIHANSLCFAFFIGGGLEYCGFYTTDPCFKAPTPCSLWLWTVIPLSNFRGGHLCLACVRLHFMAV